MLSLTVSQNRDQLLTDQIVAGIKGQIDDSASAARNQAAVDPQLRQDLQCQPFHGGRRPTTGWVAMGYLHSRRGAGFYTAAAVPARMRRPAPSRSVRQSQAQ